MRVSSRICSLLPLNRKAVINAKTINGRIEKNKKENNIFLKIPFSFLF
jgi:hypothetical protein